jgi:glucose/arabinose dehydrogenase/cytochrome c551/c552
MRFSFLVLAGAVALAVLPGAAPAAGPLDVEPEDLRPGLLAAYRSPADPVATLLRVEAKPAFFLGDSSPHPRLPPGPFEVVWSGVLRLTDPGAVAFVAHLGGELMVVVDGETVLRGRCVTADGRVGPGPRLRRTPGAYRFEARYRALAGVPARLQVGWEGDGFAREPLPAWRLGHLAADEPPALRREELAAAGREAVGRLGCARCHRSAFPGVPDPAPGPSLAGAGRRLRRAWLLRWLEDPGRARPGARMPALFAADRRGFVERWLVAEQLCGPPGKDGRADGSPAGDHRAGRLAFIRLGCAACHFLPDVDAAKQADLGRVGLTGLSDRLPAAELAAFLADPHRRYPDGRMPRLPMPPAVSGDLAAYLLLWSAPSRDAPVPEAPTAAEVAAVVRRLGVRDRAAAGSALVRHKGCAACHPGLDPAPAADVPLKDAGGQRGCAAGDTLPRYSLDGPTRRAVAAYREVAARERHPSAAEDGRRLLLRAGCARCHARDTDRPPPIEEAGSALGGAFLERLPYQRTPRLSYPHRKYTRAHLAASVRDGVTGLRPAWYSYRMPAYGDAAGELVRALAREDGELPEAADPPLRVADDPTLAPLAGSALAGFQGYACVSCHVWNGRQLAEADPGATGPDLTKVPGRVRRDWFDRFLEDPARSHPGTPMPSIFPHGQRATLGAVLGGDAARQKEALWSYLALGPAAPSPRPPPPLPVEAPAAGEPPLVAQIPVHLPAGGVLESLCVLWGTGDLLVYDLGAGAPYGLYTGASILRGVQGRLRTFTAAGTKYGNGLAVPSPLHLLGRGGPQAPGAPTLHGYDRLADGVRLRWQAPFAAGPVEIEETLCLPGLLPGRRLERELRFTGLPAGAALEVRTRVPGHRGVEVEAPAGGAETRTADGVLEVVLSPDRRGATSVTLRYGLPPAEPAPPWQGKALADLGQPEGSLRRPGYRAVAYPRVKTPSGEDRVMPAAVAVRPRDGRVFVASLKTGELFTLEDPGGDGRGARFVNYARGLFQEALSMRAEDDALYVLHRRNLTRVVDTDGDGRADRFDRVALLPHGVADTYDYAYGLARDRSGAFVLSFAPYANAHLPGSGGALRLPPGGAPQEIACGLRNPLGWAAGPGGEIFFTDNQGEWVATNKLCHLRRGLYYGFPNPAQPRHAARPAGRAAVWVPYGWARSVNGIAYDDTGGRFGPFAGQFFLAELMFGGAIIRAQVERVNGEYQGACFPFWGKGLLGPLTLAFDPRGHLYVGGITEPGWMAQPDRGALFRIDYTGELPFEIRAIHIRPGGFRLAFTRAVDRARAADPASYRLEHYRYEYTGAYGSPELDRTSVAVGSAAVSADGLSVELGCGRPVRDRVYLIAAPGVRSAGGDALVHPAGAYTVNEVPAEP